MGTQNAGKCFFAVIGNPGKLSAVVVQETGSEAYAFSGGYICQGRIMIRTVEIPDLPGIDQAVLDRFQRGGRAAPDHQGTSIEVLFANDVLFSERIGPVGDQIDAAFKQLMDGNAGDLLRLLLQGKQDIDFVPQKGLDAVFILKYGRDLDVAVRG